MIAKEAFSEWRKNEIYQELWKDIVANMEAYGAEIISREEPSNMRDQLLRGRMQGLRAVLEWEPTFLPDEEVEVENVDEV